MALVLQAYTFAQQYVSSYLHPTPTKSPMGLKLGVISTAQINPAASKLTTRISLATAVRVNGSLYYLDIGEADPVKVIHPAETHPDVILYAIASRDLDSAKQVAQKYHFKKAYGSYQDLIEDADVDIVYISLPNALHFEWAAKALRAGKHVLCEKPFTSNADEARKLVQLAKEKNLVCEEAVCNTSLSTCFKLFTDNLRSFIGNSIRPLTYSARFLTRESTAAYFAPMP